MGTVPTQRGALRRRVKVALLLARRPPLAVPPPGARVDRRRPISGPDGTPSSSPGPTPDSATPPEPEATAGRPQPPAVDPTTATGPEAGRVGPTKTLLMSPVPMTGLDDDDGWTVPLPAHRPKDDDGDV